MSIVVHVRVLKARCAGTAVVAPRVQRAVREEEERPEEAFVTERAVRQGMANAASGSLKMTCPTDHFGSIGPEFDPRRKRGLVVGDVFPNRMACRMWNAHLPHVAGIAGQSARGAQSVVLSGGYDDDLDEGDYFLYTGSGGKDLSGNKRNGAHNGDQEFSRYNMAIKKSCEEGLPVRVVRSCKEKRSAYAPKAEAIRELQELQKKEDEAKRGGKGAGEAKAKSGAKGKGAGVGAKSGKGGKGAAAAEAAEEEAEEDEEAEDDEEEAGSDDSEVEMVEGSEEGADAEGDEEAAGSEEGEDEEEEAEEGEGAAEGGGAKGKAKGGGSAQREMAQAVAFAPVRYDGLYRVHACWRVKGAASYLVCRYLFVRADNGPAPWSSEDCGDKPRMQIPERAAEEIKAARKLGEEVTYMTKTPYWEYDAASETWGWARPAPPSAVGSKGTKAAKQARPLEKQLQAAQRELKRQQKQVADSFSCLLCRQTLSRPVFTPCAHAFCLGCLQDKLDGVDAQATRHNARPSRSSSQRRPCPARGCGKDLTAFAKGMQVNGTMAGQAQSAAEAVRQKEAEVAALQARVEATAAGLPDPADGAAAAAPAADGAAAAAADGNAADGDVSADEAAEEGERPTEAAEAPKQPEAQRPSGGGAAAEPGASGGGSGGGGGGGGGGGAGDQPMAEAANTAAAGGGAAAAPAAAGDGGGGRWASEAAALAADYPDFDVGLVAAMLEDQGGDVAEVAACLKSMRRAQLKAAKPPGAAAAAGRGGKRGAGRGRGRGRGRGSAATRTAEAAAAAAAEASEGEEEAGSGDEEGRAKESESEEEVEEVEEVEEARSKAGPKGKGAAGSKAGGKAEGKPAPKRRKTGA